MDRVNKRKSDFLGMNVSTANMRLRKMIIFELVKQLKRDVCYRCQEPIQSIDEFSIEHKLPWLDKDVNLFWNLDNIAFSHLACNVRTAALGNMWNRKDRVEGMSWCTKHQKYLPETDFGRDPNNWTGLRSWCKACRKQYEYPKRIK
jgi:hypothetical protein